MPYIQTYHSHKKRYLHLHLPNPVNDSGLHQREMEQRLSLIQPCRSLTVSSSDACVSCRLLLLPTQSPLDCASARMLAGSFVLEVAVQSDCKVDRNTIYLSPEAVKLTETSSQQLRCGQAIYKHIEPLLSTTQILKRQDCQPSRPEPELRCRKEQRKGEKQCADAAHQALDHQPQLLKRAQIEHPKRLCVYKQKIYIYIYVLCMY